MAVEAQGTKDTSSDPIQDAIVATMPVFSGHPAMASDDSDKDPNATDKDGKPPVEAPDKGEADKEGDKPDGDKEDFKPKYRNHEEAEKAYKSAERAMHDAKKEAKEAKDEATRAKQELEELKAAQQTGDATKKEVKDAQKKSDEAETRKTVSKRVADALVKMNKLDTGDPDYYEKVGELWAEAGFGGANVDTKDIEALVDKKVKELESQKETQAASDKAARDGVKKANDVAAKAGLNMKEGSHDYRLFWMLAQQASKDLSFEEQVDWAINEVRSMKEGLTGIKSSEKTDKFRQENTILERGGGGPPAKKSGEAQPMSIKDALSAVERRI